MVEVNVERQCPYCHESLSLNKKEATHGNQIRCPVCRKNSKVILKGILNKRIELIKTSFF